jgi:hypothetical protein
VPPVLSATELRGAVHPEIRRTSANTIVTLLA